MLIILIISSVKILIVSGALRRREGTYHLAFVPCSTVFSAFLLTPFTL